MNLHTLRLYLATLSHLKMRQFISLLRQRLLAIPDLTAIPKTPCIRCNLGLATPVMEPVVSGHQDDSFTFLNVTRTFPRGMVDWACSDMPKLWRYNLHYFDYLLDKNRSLSGCCLFVDGWIKQNPPGTVDAWEPYTASLRIVNWVKWFLSCPDLVTVSQDWIDSLFRQTAWLERNIEYHLLANHYLKNGKALFFAGMYFSGPEADRWLRRGLEILVEESREQILADGGHFERSPMYHSIVIEDYLDVLNLALANPGMVEAGIVTALAARTRLALDFLVDITGPDGNFPLFNDAAYGISQAPTELMGYGERVLGYEPPARKQGITLSSRADTGYYIIRDVADMLVVDCGEIGPDYQPGHAHCDTLSYELWLDGRRVVVDSGVFDYENSPRRHASRSTRGHNTVMLDSSEQSEIWSVFRVARRARPLGASLELQQDGAVVFRGSHDGYRNRPGSVVHARSIVYRGRSWEISDTLQGTGEHLVENFIHLASGLSARVADDGYIEVHVPGGAMPLMKIHATGGLAVEVLAGEYYPQFGVVEENTVIRFYGRMQMPGMTGYRLQVACAKTGQYVS